MTEPKPKPLKIGGDVFVNLKPSAMGNPNKLYVCIDGTLLPLNDAKKVVKKLNEMIDFLEMEIYD